MGGVGISESKATVPDLKGNFIRSYKSAREAALTVAPDH